MEPRVCPDCGASNDADADACTECGAQLTSSGHRFRLSSDAFDAISGAAVLQSSRHKLKGAGRATMEMDAPPDLMHPHTIAELGGETTVADTEPEPEGGLSALRIKVDRDISLDSGERPKSTVGATLELDSIDGPIPDAEETEKINTRALQEVAKSAKSSGVRRTVEIGSLEHGALQLEESINDQTLEVDVPPPREEPPKRKLSPLLTRVLPLAVISGTAIGIFAIASIKTIREDEEAESAVEETPEISLEAPPTVELESVEESVYGMTDDNKEAWLALCFRVSDHATTECRLSYLRDTGEYPHSLVSIPALTVDMYEVSNGSYEACVADGGCPDRDLDACQYHTMHRWEMGVDVPSSMLSAEMPAICVSYEEAQTYCEWRDMRLPTPEEWERIGRRGGDNNFPWGNFWAPGIINWAERDMGTFPIPGRLDGAQLTAEVDDYPDGATRDDVHNMLGNVSEWVQRSERDEDEGTAGIRGGSYIDDIRTMRLDAPRVHSPDPPLELRRVSVCRNTLALALREPPPCGRGASTCGGDLPTLRAERAELPRFARGSSSPSGSGIFARLARSGIFRALPAGFLVVANTRADQARRVPERARRGKSPPPGGRSPRNARKFPAPTAQRVQSRPQRRRRLQSTPSRRANTIRIHGEFQRSITRRRLTWTTRASGNSRLRIRLTGSSQWRPPEASASLLQQLRAGLDITKLGGAVHAEEDLLVAERECLLRLPRWRSACRRPRLRSRS